MERERLTITLKQSVLRYIDSLIDGTTIRNRSHAIETVISGAMQPAVSQALILAAGEGVKMRPYTYEIPKPMLTVKGKPILEHIIEQLRNNDIRDIIIAVSHLGDVIKNHFGDGSKYGVKIRYIEETQPSGTAGPIRRAKDLLGDQPFLVYYGDVLAAINIRDLIDYHIQFGSIATLALTSVADPSAYGAVRMSGQKIVEVIEKPKDMATASRVVLAGIQVLDKKIFDHMPSSGAAMLEEDVLPNLAKDGKLNGYLFEGAWFDVGTPDVYERALTEWLSPR